MNDYNYPSSFDHEKECKCCESTYDKRRTDECPECGYDEYSYPDHEDYADHMLKHGNWPEWIENKYEHLMEE